MRFKDITGQEELKQHLVRSIDTGRISHAQLFTGAAGAGTLPLAIAYVQYLNCPNRHDGDSCGECPSCRKIAALAHPDLHFVFPVNKQGKKSGEVVRSDDFIEDWREIVESTGGYFSAQEWFDRLDLGKTLKGMISAKETDEIIRKLSFKSFEAEYKTMIIWLPETMNEEAANKILKILEEPWDKTLFILVTERADRLLQTILSRTQEVAVPRLKPEVLEDVVRESGEQDEAKVRNVARLANGDLSPWPASMLNSFFTFFLVGIVFAGLHLQDGQVRRDRMHNLISVGKKFVFLIHREKDLINRLGDRVSVRVNIPGRRFTYQRPRLEVDGKALVRDHVNDTDHVGACYAFIEFVAHVVGGVE